MNRKQRLKGYMEKISPEEGMLESLSDDDHLLEAIESDPKASDEEREDAKRGLERIKTGQNVSDAEADALEALVLPKERPVLFVENDTFSIPGWPFEHLDQAEPRRNIEAAIPSIGRIELPNSSLPYGGTGFVVGDGLVMTNRHVAILFANGVGREGLSFQSGQSADVDMKRENNSSDSRLFHVDRIVMIHPFWDMALLSVSGLDDGSRPLRFSTENPGDMKGREVAVIGYPALDTRNDIELQNRIFEKVFNVKRLQPGKLGVRQDYPSFGNLVPASTHDSSTLGGNSGSAVIDVKTGDVVALHFAGRYLEANFAVPSYELARDRRVEAAGVNFASSIVSGTTPWDSVWEEADPQVESARTIQLQEPAGAGVRGLSLGDGASWSIPLEVTVRLGNPRQQPNDGGAATTASLGGGGGADVERMAEPFRDEDYDGRTGYDEKYLGIRLRMPTVVDKKIASKLDDGKIVIPYEHFSVVMHKKRRLALFTASNVDARPESRRPDPDQVYTRAGLSGLGKNDIEKWFSDPRIPEIHQLPDKFFTRDRKAFDKGHIVRRDDVAWGKTFEELRRANGDTYHVTNCSPQVAGFNRSQMGGIWGKLENLVLKQSKSEMEKYCVIAGPVLDPNDRVFKGRDLEGTVRIQIPTRYWKIVVARSGGKLESFAFVLDQDLSDVEWEFAVSTALKSKMISVPDLQALLPDIDFPPEIESSDQFESDDGESVRALGGIDRYVGPGAQS